MLRKLLAATVLSLAMLPCRAETALKFDWPDGLAATIIYTKSRTRTQGDQPPQQQEASMAYRQTARRQGDGVVVSAEITDASELLNKLPPGEREKMKLLLSAGMPPIRVTPAGSFEDIHDIDAFREHLRGFFSGLLSNSAHRQKMQGALESITSREFLRAAAAQQWNAMVGTWAGVAFEPGESYPLESEADLPLVPGLKMKVAQRYRLIKEVDCTRAGQVRRCVELEATTSSVDESVRDAFNGVGKKLTGDASLFSPDAIKDFVLESRTRLVTEPDTLVPHELETEKTISFVSKEGGKAVRIANREWAVSRFKYSQL